MAELKTRQTEQSVDAYIDAIADEAGAILDELIQE